MPHFGTFTIIGLVLGFLYYLTILTILILVIIFIIKKLRNKK